jgi:hypothetical protein
MKQNSPTKDSEAEGRIVLNNTSQRELSRKTPTGSLILTQLSFLGKNAIITTAAYLANPLTSKAKKIITIPLEL